MNSVLSPRLFLNVYVRFQYFDYRKVEFFCKFPVAVIVCRNCHNCTRSIRNKDVICNPYRNELSVYRIDCVASAENAGLVLVQIRSFKVRFFCRKFNIFFNKSFLFRRSKLLYKRVFRRNNHICCAEQRITARCVYSKLLVSRVTVLVRYGERNFCTGRFSNPVALHKLYAFRPVKRV